MTLSCPKCLSTQAIKNGQHHGKQRYRCKSCGCQYTRADRHGYPAHQKYIAVLLYLQGLSMNAIAKLLSVSTPSVLRWVRSLAQKAVQKPLPTEAAIVEVDEMWHFLTSKKTNDGSGKLIVTYPVDCWTGNVALVIKPRLNA